MKEFKERMVKALLPQIILTQASIRPIYGYDLIKYIRKRFKGVYLGPSTVYPALNNLEKQGIIQSHWETPNERPRKVYTLTNKGKLLLTQTSTVLAFVNRMIEVKT